ncbi:MAG: RcnB family protein [Gammaproteobacteria bacterium]
MKRMAVVGTLVASLMAASVAMAGQGSRGNGDDHRDDHRDAPRAAQGHVEQRHYDRDHSDQRRYDNGRYDQSRDHTFRPAPSAPRYVYRPAPRHYSVYRAPRGYYAHTWHRGERLPRSYYATSYVVNDYRDCGLRAPPRGYHWVRVNGDAVLAAVATGIVLETIFHVF